MKVFISCLKSLEQFHGLGLSINCVPGNEAGYSCKGHWHLMGRVTAVSLHLIRSLSNDDSDADENGKTAIGLDWHVHHVFLYISLPSLHYYNVKMSIFTFCRGRERKTTFLFLSLDSLLEFNSRKNYQHVTNWTRWKKRDKVWGSATSLFNWRFRRRCRPCCLSSLVLLIKPITRPYSLWNMTNRTTTAAALKTSLKKWICVLLISIAITPTNLLCQIQANSF